MQIKVRRKYQQKDHQENPPNYRHKNIWIYKKPGNNWRESKNTLKIPRELQLEIQQKQKLIWCAGRTMS